MFFLHFNHVEAKAIFPCYFVAAREMVDPLVLINAFIEVGFARRRGPHYVPFMTLRVVKTVSFEHGSHKLRITS